LTKEEVELRYSQAQTAYTDGDLRRAARLLHECYEATRSSNLLFNLAQLYRELKECPRALAYYERYLADVKTGGRAEDAKTHVTALRLECPETEPQIEPVRSEPKPTTPPTAAPPPPLPDRTNPWTVAGWTTLGTGAVAAAATVYASLEMKHARDDVEHPRIQNGKIDGDYLAERQDDFYRNRTWALAFGAATTGLVGFGLYALAVAAPRHEARQERARTLSVAVLPGHATIVYGFKF
jgi:hypothetical protein